MEGNKQMLLLRTYRTNGKATHRSSLGMHMVTYLTRQVHLHQLLSLTGEYGYDLEMSQ
jgi:hypothetical protein